MSPIQQKPILHGRDHAEGGADPIPGLGGGAAHEIQDEGTPLTDRAALNFEGGGVTATDDAGNDATIVTIPGQTFLSPQPGHRIGTTEDRWYSAGVVNATGTTTNTTVANRLEALPFIPSRDMTLDRVAVQVTAAVAGNARLGMWTGTSNIYPDALLFDTGTFSVGSTGPKVTTISQALDAGSLYWLGIVVSVATVQLRSWQAAACMAFVGHAAWSGTTQSPMAFGWYVAGAGVGALPNPFTGSATPMTANDGVPAAISVRGT